MPMDVYMIKRSRRAKKILTLILVVPIAVCIIFAMATNIIIASQYDDYIYTDLQKIPLKKVALVLGTSRKYYGRPNPYYDTRMEAAAALYHSGKVKQILVSGDNSEKYYDEPTDMMGDLVSLGVPQEDILLDYAGLRTLDSIIRANEVFSLGEFIIVSQRFHCRRALFIARSNGIPAIAYAAAEVRHAGHYRIMLREFFARIKAGLDVWLLNTPPKYLEEKKKITLRQNPTGIEKRSIEYCC